MRGKILGQCISNVIFWEKSNKWDESVVSLPLNLDVMVCCSKEEHAQENSVVTESWIQSLCDLLCYFTLLLLLFHVPFGMLRVGVKWEVTCQILKWCLLMTYPFASSAILNDMSQIIFFKWCGSCDLWMKVTCNTLLVIWF